MLGSLGQSEVGTELEVVQSRTLLTRAILESGLNVDVKDIQRGRIRVWRWLLSGRDYRMLQPAITVRQAAVIDPTLAAKNLYVEFERTANTRSRNTSFSVTLA